MTVPCFKGATKGPRGLSEADKFCRKSLVNGANSPFADVLQWGRVVIWKDSMLLKTPHHSKKTTSYVQKNLPMELPHCSVGNSTTHEK